MTTAVDVTHIERPNLPWRTERRTECGLDVAGHPTWTRAEAIAHARRLGKTRFAMVVCMTCKGTAERHATWDEDPASCMGRYATRLTLRWDDSPERRRFADELRAIALLVEAHRDEFDEALAALAAAQPLDELRQRRART